MHILFHPLYTHLHQFVQIRPVLRIQHTTLIIKTFIQIFLQFIHKHKFPKIIHIKFSSIL